MALKDILKKKEKAADNDETPPRTPPQTSPRVNQFTFLRTDSQTQEIIAPPAFEGDEEDEVTGPSPATPERKRGLGRFRKHSNASPSTSPAPKDHRRLSERLHISAISRASSSSSVNVPSGLPVIEDAYTEKGDRQETEAKWEERATILASSSAARPASSGSPLVSLSELSLNQDAGSKGAPVSRPRSISDAAGDNNIQEAIRLHESGDPENLAKATAMFHALAEGGNVLSQVLYGLSLRHGWGCEPNATLAVQYLSQAASNSASIESEALKAGMKKGGAAKGELVLAIFELANCFRNGWGVGVDKVAAREYYEVAANLGDTDAMNEAAWCYLEGFGGKKDKFKAAQLLRLAEKSGNKTLGNTWIWKEKYNPK